MYYALLISASPLLNILSCDAKVGGVYYSSMGAAAGAVADGGQLLLRSTDFTENLDLSRPCESASNIEPNRHRSVTQLKSQYAEL